jgi:protein-export membrane protein SecD
MKIFRAASPLVLFLLPLCLALSCASMSGPRDRGGFYLVLAVKADAAQLDQNIAHTMAVIQRRCDSLAIYCNAQRESGYNSNRIRLRVSTSLDRTRVKNVLLSRGLELRAVISPPSPSPIESYDTQAEAAAAAARTGGEAMHVAENEQNENKHLTGKFVVLKREPIITGEDILDAGVATMRGRDEDYQITFRVKPDGAERFGSWTGANINNYLAIVWNGDVRSIAYIKSRITDSGEIMGRFTKQQAEDIALVLKSGNLPAPVETLAEGTYKP